MKKATRGITKKRPAERHKRPEAPGTPIMVRVQPPMLAAVDSWIGKQEGRKPTRPEAIRMLVGRALK